MWDKYDRIWPEIKKLIKKTRQNASGGLFLVNYMVISDLRTSPFHKQFIDAKTGYIGHSWGWRSLRISDDYQIFRGRTLTPFRESSNHKTVFGEGSWNKYEEEIWVLVRCGFGKFQTFCKNQGHGAKPAFGSKAGTLVREKKKKSGLFFQKKKKEKYTLFNN